MRIGIDIDDTICDTWKFLIPYISKNFKMDKKFLKNTTKPYDQACNCTYEEYCNFAKKHYGKYALRYKLKKDARKIINKLKKEGNEIIFITARSYNGFIDPYETSYKYLIKNKICFDKLIVNRKDKEIVCEEEKIDLFIDDSVDNCTNVSTKNIKVLLYDASWNQNCNIFKRVISWKQIYKEIEVLKNGRQNFNK